MPFPSFYIQVLKRDQKAHYSWPCSLLCHEPKIGFWATASRAPRFLDHHTKGQRFHFETHSMEWFWRGLPFSVGLSFDPVSDRLNYYCNIHEPLLESPEGLSFVDLDLDVVKNVRYPMVSIIDQDEFEEHIIKYSYPSVYEALIPCIAEALAERLEQDEIFKSAFVREVFAKVYKNPEGLCAIPSEIATRISGHFVKYPWREELLISFPCED